MSLSYDTGIIAGDIYFVKELKELKVFLLNGFGKDRLVVKVEAGGYTDADIKLNSKIMGVIDSDAKTKPLSAGELQQLDSWCDANMPYSNIIDGAMDMKKSINMFRTTPWIKMKALQLLTLDDASKKMGEGDKTDVRIIAKVLNAAGGLERLGGVIAADFFIGNTDRFVTGGAGGRWAGETLKALVNVGNVFIAIDPSQKKGSVAGLDFLDPVGIGRSLSQDLGYRQDDWMGKLLTKANSGLRMEFCHDVIADLNFVLGPRKRSFSFLRTKRLDSDAANRLNWGMEDAADKIKNKLRQYKQGHGGVLPAGFQARVGVLGWTL